MKRYQFSLRITALVIIFLSSFTVFAQEEPVESQPNNLKGTFEGMMEKYSTYEQYKVIPITRMNQFWAEVNDSLVTKDKSNAKLKGEIIALKAMIDSLNSELSTVKANLETSEETNSEISFLGIPFDKTIYHIMVWAIIILLAALTILTYFMYIRSNGLTSRFKKDLEQLRHEYDDHRDKSREAQVKLKRELQTAVNTIDEMKRGGSRR
ncbi:MAG: hypothetical protein CMB80_18505 [Flammeovirgaceae bacterium]|nr:hypothetical protein [Flammeovirgaceae bacterium]|tara:strand:- start:665 stop:1291 length:627 start_codon:yes stop_codon:yes gene_type:complete